MEHKTKKPLWAKYKELMARYASLEKDCAELERRVGGIRAARDKRDKFLELSKLQYAYDEWCECGITQDYSNLFQRWIDANRTIQNRTMKALQYLEALVRSGKKCKELEVALQEAQQEKRLAGVAMHDFSRTAPQER